LGITAEFDHPKFHTAVEALTAACRTYGKTPGVLAGSVPQARDWREKGFRCLCFGTDVSVFQSALSNALQTLRIEG